MSELKIADIANDEWMKASKLTGLKLPFITPYSADVDQGVENVGEDTCHVEEYVSIQDTMRKYLRDGMPDLSNEYAFADDEVDFDERPSDVFDNEDVLDQQMDLEDYLERHPAETLDSVSAAAGAASATANDKQATQGASEEAKGAETGSGEA